MANAQTFDKVVATVTTTDAATLTTLVSYTVPTNTVCNCEFTAVGKDASGNGAIAKYVQSVRNVSGSLTLIGTLTGLLTFLNGSDAILSTAAITIDTSGTTVRLRINGIAATTIGWLGEIRAMVN